MCVKILRPIWKWLLAGAFSNILPITSRQNTNSVDGKNGCGSINYHTWRISLFVRGLLSKQWWIFDHMPEELLTGETQQGNFLIQYNPFLNESTCGAAALSVAISWPFLFHTFLSISTHWFTFFCFPWVYIGCVTSYCPKKSRKAKERKTATHKG